MRSGSTSSVGAVRLPDTHRGCDEYVSLFFLLERRVRENPSPQTPTVLGLPVEVEGKLADPGVEPFLVWGVHGYLCRDSRRADNCIVGSFLLLSL